MIPTPMITDHRNIGTVSLYREAARDARRREPDNAASAMMGKGLRAAAATMWTSDGPPLTFTCRSTAKERQDPWCSVEEHVESNKR